jgi:hypothetical protein
MPDAILELAAVPPGSYARPLMIGTTEDLERELDRLGRKFERLGDGTYVVSVGMAGSPVALRLSPPVLVAQVTLGNVTAQAPERRAALFQRLLELNATSLVHAAYGLEGSTIVIAAALVLESADPNELEAVLSDMDMALAEHVPSLRGLVD